MLRDEEVVGIVSDYKGEHVDDQRDYVCHAGVAKSYVTLRGRLARSYAVASSRRLPPATGFAAVDDVKAVPLSDEGRERYAHFLTLPKPRAFVVYEDGAWRFYAKDPEAIHQQPSSRAFTLGDNRCRRIAQHSPHRKLLFEIPSGHPYGQREQGHGDRRDPGQRLH